MAAGNANFEDALAGLEAARKSLESEQLETKKLLKEADDDRKQAEEYRKKLDNQRDNATKIAKREAASILSEARKTADEIMNELNAMKRKAAENADWKKLNEDRADVFRKINEAEDKLATKAVNDEEDYIKPSRDIVPGDKVKLRGLGVTADVISIETDGTLSLMAGVMKVTAGQDEVILVEAGESPDIKKYRKKSEAKLRKLMAKPEVDLRGMNTDEALPMLERFLDTARLAKLHNVTVIHGKGTGVLRQAVHNALRREHGIKSFRLGRYGEGEDGVTIVELT